MAAIDDEDGDFTPFSLTNASHFINKENPIRMVAGITCCLSILGSLLIILSFILQKRRTKAREVLFHISLMDFGVGMANLIGLSVYFDSYFSMHKTVPAYIDGLCKTQAFFAAFCTLASIYWTTALAGYLYVVILYRRNPTYSLYFVRFCYFICYGLALLISLWLVLIGHLGYSPYNSSGWCSLIAVDPKLPPGSFIDQTRRRYLFITIFANDLWIYIATIMIIILYVAIKGLLSDQLRVAKEYHNITVRNFWSSMNSVDYKFILIPVIFVCLRVWSCILTILFIFADLKEKDLNPKGIKFLLYLSGMGDSGQGFTNAILFIVFTKSIRRIFIDLLLCKCRDKNRGKSSSSEENYNIQKQIEESQSSASPLLHGNKESSSPFQSMVQDSSGSVRTTTTTTTTTDTKYSAT